MSQIKKLLFNHKNKTHISRKKFETFKTNILISTGSIFDRD